MFLSTAQKRMILDISMTQTHNKTPSSCLISFPMLFYHRGELIIMKSKWLQDIKAYRCTMFKSLHCKQL